MKAFRFRLDQALRWREAQATLQEMRVASASSRVAQLEKALDAEARAMLESAEAVASHPAADAMQPYAAYRVVRLATIQKYQTELRAARRDLTKETDRLVEAHRNVEIFAKLRSEERAAWQRNADREQAAFADEEFLNRRRSRET